MRGIGCHNQNEGLYAFYPLILRVDGQRRRSGFVNAYGVVKFDFFKLFGRILLRVEILARGDRRFFHISVADGKSERVIINDIFKRDGFPRFFHLRSCRKLQSQDGL